MSSPVKRLWMTVRGGDGTVRVVAVDTPDYEDWWDHIEAFDDLFNTDLWNLIDRDTASGARLVPYLPHSGCEPVPDLVVEDAEDVARLRRILKEEE